jgi:hypothetical protein
MAARRRPAARDWSKARQFSKTAETAADNSLPRHTRGVIPANAGIHLFSRDEPAVRRWIPRVRGNDIVFWATRKPNLDMTWLGSAQLCLFGKAGVTAPPHTANPPLRQPGPIVSRQPA